MFLRGTKTQYSKDLKVEQQRKEELIHELYIYHTGIELSLLFHVITLQVRYKCSAENTSEAWKLHEHLRYTDQLDRE